MIDDLYPNELVDIEPIPETSIDNFRSIPVKADGLLEKPKLEEDEVFLERVMGLDWGWIIDPQGMYLPENMSHKKVFIHPDGLDPTKVNTVSVYGRMNSEGNIASLSKPMWCKFDNKSVYDGQWAIALEGTTGLSSDIRILGLIVEKK